MHKVKFPNVDLLPHPKAARQAAGLTQEQVRVQARIGLQTVCRAEAHGRWPARLPVLKRYLTVLGLSA